MAPRPERRSVAKLLESPDQSLLDLVDSLLDKGVVLDGELVLGLADVDLVYVRLGVLLAAADRVLPQASSRTSPGTRNLEPGTE
jgi:gas vesicle protein GvpA/GvpJ/GvpM family